MFSSAEIPRNQSGATELPDRAQQAREEIINDEVASSPAKMIRR